MIKSIVTDAAFCAVNDQKTGLVPVWDKVLEQSILQADDKNKTAIGKYHLCTVGLLSLRFVDFSSS